MTRKSLSTQQIAALWRAYKQRQSAQYVSIKCAVSRNTAAKYILNHNFAERLAKLLAKANEFVDEDQALSLANTLKPLANARALLLEQLLAHVKKGELKATISDIDKIVRLERYLRGEPEAHTEQAVSFEWLDADEDEDE